MSESSLNSEQLPFSYKLVIVSSAVVLFALGVVYFTQLHPAVETSFQVYGSKQVVAGAPAAFRLVQYDPVQKKNLPARIVAARLSQGEQIQETPGQDDSTSLPADIVLAPTTFPTGEATLELDIEGWKLEERTITIPVTIVQPQDKPALNILRDVAASVPETDLVIGLHPGFGALVDSVENPIWLRAQTSEGEPIPATVTFWCKEEQEPGIVQTSAAGLARLPCELDGLSGAINLTLTHSNKSLVWQERLPADAFTGVSSAVNDSGNISVQVYTSSPANTLHCVFWAGNSPIQWQTVTTKEHKARIEWQPPADGLYWFTCNDHYLSGEGFLASTAVPAFASAGDFIKFVGSITTERQRVTLPLNVQDDPLAADYIRAHLKPTHAGFEQIHNTYHSDLESERRGAARMRNLLLILIALVGFGLLLWAVAVAAGQHRRLRKDFDEFQRSEDVGDELEVEGIGRKRPFLPTVLVLLAGMANLVALIWLLSLIFLD